MGEKEDLKAWLRELRGSRTQAELAEILRVHPRTVMNAENPRMGFPNGLTMIRLLRELGVAADAPVRAEPSLAELLLGLEGKVDRQGEATAKTLAGLARDLRAIRRWLEPPETQASQEPG